jgi:hypothetical protein
LKIPQNSEILKEDHIADCLYASEHNKSIKLLGAIAIF